MITKPLRITAMLAMLANSSFALAQDDAEPKAEPAALPTASDGPGNMVYTVPVLKQKWEAQAVLNTSRDKIVHFSNDEDIVFVQSSAGTVTALNSESGRRMWSAQVGRSDEVAMRASSDSQFVTIAVGPVLHTFDKFSGQKLFAFRLPESPSGPPLMTRREIVKNNTVRVERNVFVPMSDKSVVAYDVEKLIYLGQHGALKKDVPRALAWKFGSGELTRFAPAAGLDRIVISSDAGNLHVLSMTEPNEGKSQYQFLMNSRTTAPLTVVTRDDREYLLAACDNNRLFCIFLRLYGASPGTQNSEGDLKWTIPMSHTVTKPIVVVGQDVFVLSEENELRKFSLDTGLPVEVSRGIDAIITQTEGVTGKVPVYGASVSASVHGPLAVSPIQVENRSTGQIVTSVVFDLSRCAAPLSFTADESGNPVLSVEASSAAAVGYRKASLSEDRKVLTLELTDFQPGEQFSLLPGFEHPEKADIELHDRDLAGGEVKALVSPLRTSVLASVSREGRIEPLAPRILTGRWKESPELWSVPGVTSMAAVSRNAVHVVNTSGEIISVNRLTGERTNVYPIREYTVQVANDLTDRIYITTTSGRVVCLAETRFEMGLLPLPIGGTISWLYYPKQELAPEFAAYHQNPGRRPLMPDVPKTDPSVPEGAGSDTP